MNNQTETPIQINDKALLKVNNLTIKIPGVYGDVEIVSNINLEIGDGEIVGLVGESGCGKSLTGLAIMGLLPRGVRSTGEIMWKHKSLLPMTARERRNMMGSEIGMVYQDPLLSLNPGMTIQKQLLQILKRSNKHRDTTPSDLLQMVHLTDSDAIVRAYPHQISGGQRQRVLIAMALSQEPKLLVADEPTTALDETVQAQIMDLLQELQKEMGFSTLLISHNIALVDKFCQRTCVMYAGQAVEQGPTKSLIRSARHPYTHGLAKSIISLERKERPADSIDGVVPPPFLFVDGCRFSDRCPNAQDICPNERPPLQQYDNSRGFTCHFPINEGTLV